MPSVIADLSAREKISQASLFALGYNYSIPLDKWNIADMACDFIYTKNTPVDFEIPGTLSVIHDYTAWIIHKDKPRTYPLLTVQQYAVQGQRSSDLNFIYVQIHDVDHTLIEKVKADATAVLILDTKNKHGMAEQRRVFAELINEACDVPVIIMRAYQNLTFDEFQLYAATDLGGLLIDGLGDGIFISAHGISSDKQINQTAFNILQATRTRISKTEYISCPSCGRTLFDLQETTANIRSRTSHLKGVKIGIMGCIVNGPGEMADADYGYVGSGPGRITLYKGKEVVRKNVPTAQAVDELVNLIREHGDWIEPA